MPVHGVVFQKDHFARDASGLSQKRLGIIRVVKNVDETYNIETIVCEWKMLAVKSVDGNLCVGPQENVYAAN